MLALIQRNIKLFFRDKMTVFFSLLSSLILIGLYFVFLEGTLSVEVADYIDPDLIMFNWLIAGILAINSISTTLTAFGTKVKDDEKDISKDFHSTPISKAQVAGGYIGAAFAISLLVSIFTLFIGELIIYFQYGSIMDFVTFLKVLALTLVTVFSNSALLSLVILFVDSSGAYSLFSSVVGSLSGFIAGVYIPVGVLPDWVASIIKFVPSTQAASLLRKALMQNEFQKMSGAPNELILEVKETLGVIFTWGDGYITTTQSLIYVLLSGVIFYLLAVWKLSKEDSNN